MKRKRLDRDTWWEFKKYSKKPEYYQMRLDTDTYHGMVCMLRMVDGEHHCWRFPMSGKVEVTGEGIIWLQLLPDNAQHLVSVYYKPSPKVIRGVEYTHSVTVWYVDITEGYEYDSDGVIIYTDKYLDVIFTPAGDLMVVDRDELDEALGNGDITQQQYESAILEGERVIEKYCADIENTEVFCSEILREVNRRIAGGACGIFGK